MNDNYERVAVVLTVVFGALIIGGLMAANIARDNHTGFMWALGAAGAAWALAPAVLFNKPRLYRGLVVLSMILVIVSILSYVR